MVGRQGESILIGNTAQRSGPYISCTEAEWNRFLLSAKCGDFDDLGRGRP